jgi:flagellar protein FliO/FliZ
MIKLILLPRALAPVTAVLCACLLAFAGSASAFSPTVKGGGGENTPLNLTTSTGSSHSTAGGTGGASIVRTIVGLAIVIAVIWGLAWILRQVKTRHEGGGGSHQSSAGLASVAALTLGSGRSVHLVRAGNDYVLLGSTEHGVAPIHRYTEEQAREAGLLGDDDLLLEAAPERSRFTAIASQIVTGTGRVIGQGTVPGRDRIAGQGAVGGHPGLSGRGGLPGSSPAIGPRSDPMRMSSPSSGLIERMREWTVRH